MDSQFVPIFMQLVLILSPINYLFMHFDETKSMDLIQQKHVLVKTGVTVLLALFAAIFLGQALLVWFPISVASRQLTFGLLLFMLALSMIDTERPLSSNGTTHCRSPHYFPQFAGRVSPAVLANVLFLSSDQTGHLFVIFIACTCALLLFCLLLFLCDRYSPRKNFLLAMLGMQKLIGLLLAIVAVDKIFGGVHHYFILS